MVWLHPFDDAEFAFYWNYDVKSVFNMGMMTKFVGTALLNVFFFAAFLLSFVITPWKVMTLLQYCQKGITTFTTHFVLKWCRFLFKIYRMRSISFPYRSNFQNVAGVAFGLIFRCSFCSFHIYMWYPQTDAWLTRILFWRMWSAYFSFAWKCWRSLDLHIQGSIQKAGHRAMVHLPS